MEGKDETITANSLAEGLGISGSRGSRGRKRGRRSAGLGSQGRPTRLLGTGAILALLSSLGTPSSGGGGAGVMADPVLSGMETRALEYMYYNNKNRFAPSFIVPEDQPRAVTSGLSITQTGATHNDYLTSALVEVVAASPEPKKGSLRFTDVTVESTGGTLKGVYLEYNGLLTIKGNATLAEYEAALHSVEYEAPASYTIWDDYNTHRKNVTFTVINSDDVYSNIVTRPILLRTSARVCTDRSACYIGYPAIFGAM